MRQPRTSDGFRWTLALAVVLFLHAAGPVARASEDPARGRGAVAAGLFADKDTPVEITADRMEFQRKRSTIVYKGNVQVVRDGVKIASDVLMARYDAKGGVLTSVVAEGKVRVSHGGRVMTGDKAVFDGADETITVSGNTVVRDGNSSISGSRITIYVNEDRSVVENSEGRVKAVI
ncbi:MAG: hypothetical protein OXN22_12385, partial [Deltaproteobacteria bacterium]|nr:hypothetical protein [Deltaproteobacteria bacterium]